MIRSPPSEKLVTSGPFKLGGGGRRHFVGLADELKQAFVQMVVTERGDKLRMSSEEVAQAKIYSGVDSVRLGLVDDIGGETEAIEKAASLAGISGYDLVDINVEVFRIFNEKIMRILEPFFVSDESQSGVSDIRALFSLQGEGTQADGANLEMLRRLFLPSGIDKAQEEALPGFPLKVKPPNVYYLYVGPSE